MSASGAELEALVLGLDPVYLDLVFTGLKRVPRPGEEVFARGLAIMPGGVFNVAAALAKLGVSTALCADVDTGLVGDLIVTRIREAGIDDRFLRRVQSGGLAITVSYSLKGERAFLSYKDDHAPWQDAIEIYRQVRPRLLVCPGFPARSDQEQTMGSLSEAARCDETPILIDACHTTSSVEDPSAARAVAMADVFFCNMAECLALTGERDWQAAADRLLAFTGAVVIKLGREGGAYVSREESHLVEAPKVEVVDTTGAGDCFVAGFAFGMLRGLSRRDCLRAAVLQGSASVRGAGGTATLLDHDALMRELIG